MSNILWYERFHTAWILRMAGLLNSGVTDDASFLRVVVLICADNGHDVNFDVNLTLEHEKLVSNLFIRNQ